MDLSPFYVTTNPTYKNLCLLRERFAQKEKSVSVQNKSQTESKPIKNELFNEIEDIWETDMNDEEIEILSAVSKVLRIFLLSIFNSVQIFQMNN